MSIPVLSQVFTEARRLAIAGSVVARGDFRLKKLLPPLEQAGQQAPVFAKIAEAANAVIESPEESSAGALLELTSLVNAVLYTQGETGLAGTLEPIETTDLGGVATQTSARVLKPLLEALSSTGSGRLELVKDAFERGLFRDLRLVKPALTALDDPYPEIAALITEKVLPLYGKAILPELAAKYDPKGTRGHPRRLALMHTIDPAGTRELVKAALEGGSKEVKVAAISCLGADPDDLAFLIEQASAKAQDVRAAAYQALARVNDPQAVAVLQKALASKDYAAVGHAIRQGRNPKLVDLLVAEIQTGVAELLKLKDKKAVTLLVNRLTHHLRAFPRGEHPTADALLLDLFARRAEFASIKGEGQSGADVVETVIEAMLEGSPALQLKLAHAHAELTAEELGSAFDAARKCFTPAQVFDAFSPYLTAKVDEKKKGKDAAWAKREAICDALESFTHSNFWYHEVQIREEHRPQHDPRWLDLAVRIKRLDLVHAVARPGHAGAEAFAKAEFDAELKKAKSPDDVRNELALLVTLKHAALTDAFFAAMAKRGKKVNYYSYWYTRLVPKLPREALPRLEELVAAMPENEANQWLNAIEQLRTKT